MIRKVLRKIRLISIILKLSKREPNDYSFGYKVRKILGLYQKNEKIEVEEIFEETPKP